MHRRMLENSTLSQVDINLQKLLVWLYYKTAKVSEIDGRSDVYGLWFKSQSS